MYLTLLFDHRFYRDRSGRIFSLQNYNYQTIKERYLGTFDRIRIVARVADDPRVEQWPAYSEGDGVEVISLGDWNGPAGFLHRRWAISKLLFPQLESDGAIIAITPGIVGYISREHLLRSGHPYAVEVVGDPYDTFSSGAVKHPLRPFIRWWFSRELRRQCSYACGALYVTREALQRRYPCPARAVGISDVILRDEAFTSKSRPRARAGKRLTLIMVGSLEQLYKAPDVLIDAFAQCISQGFDLRLVFVGDGKERKNLQAKVRQANLADRIQFLGGLPAGEAVRFELDRADLFLLPSKQEGLPRAMLEAMARGLPCIGSSVGGIPELLHSEDTVPPGDSQALVAKIRDVVTDPDRMAHVEAQP